MPHLPGQPHASGGLDRASQPQTPHEASLRAHSAPAPGTAQFTVVIGPPQVAQAPLRPRRRSGGGSATAGVVAYLTSEEEPWRRERRRRLDSGA